MDQKSFIERMKSEVKSLETNLRKERAAFLSWFLINYFKVDQDDAVDYVCDSPNDKGIDGIFVNDIEEEIYIFQSKYSPNPGYDQGDNDLKKFVGAKNWFKSSENINFLDSSYASNELKSLVKKLNLFEKIENDYSLYSVFVTNKKFDHNANDYLKVTDEYFDAWDLKRLYKEYIYTGKDLPVIGKYSFTYKPANAINGKINKNKEFFIFPVKVIELVKLDGIQDKRLFSKNVRFSLGRTRVNRDIKKTIQNNEEHKNVFLYHNGITLICEKVRLSKDKIEIENYAIVNGCQSTITFYENRDSLSKDLEVLLKVIEIGNEEELSRKITYYTNNQNAISLKDLKSNDKIQQDLQEQFKTVFNHQLFFRIKRGEDDSAYQDTIDNDFAAQLITAFYLKEPHTTHQKTKIFSDNYNKIFSKKVNAYYIYLLNCMYNAIDKNIDKIEHEGVKTYKTTRFFFLYVFRIILEQDQIGKELIKDSMAFYNKYSKKDFIELFSVLFNLIVHDFNYLVKEISSDDEYFDYKNDFRSFKKVDEMASKMLVDYKKSLNRHPEDSFDKIIQK